jgi:hypothetical protein
MLGSLDNNIFVGCHFGNVRNEVAGLALQSTQFSGCRIGAFDDGGGPSGVAWDNVLLTNSRVIGVPPGTQIFGDNWKISDTRFGANLILVGDNHEVTNCESETSVGNGRLVIGGNNCKVTNYHATSSVLTSGITGQNNMLTNCQFAGGLILGGTGTQMENSRVGFTGTVMSSNIQIDNCDFEGQVGVGAGGGLSNLQISNSRFSFGGTSLDIGMSGAVSDLRMDNCVADGSLVVEELSDSFFNNCKWGGTSSSSLNGPAAGDISNLHFVGCTWTAPGPSTFDINNNENTSFTECVFGSSIDSVGGTLDSVTFDTCRGASGVSLSSSGSPLGLTDVRIHNCDFGDSILIAGPGPITSTDLQITDTTLAATAGIFFVPPAGSSNTRTRIEGVISPAGLHINRAITDLQIKNCTILTGILQILLGDGDTLNGAQISGNVIPSNIRLTGVAIVATTNTYNDVQLSGNRFATLSLGTPTAGATTTFNRLTVNDCVLTGSVTLDSAAASTINFTALKIQDSSIATGIEFQPANLGSRLECLISGCNMGTFTDRAVGLTQDMTITDSFFTGLLVTDSVQFGTSGVAKTGGVDRLIISNCSLLGNLRVNAAAPPTTNSLTITGNRIGQSGVADRVLEISAAIPNCVITSNWIRNAAGSLVVAIPTLPVAASSRIEIVTPAEPAGSRNLNIAAP